MSVLFLAVLLGGCAGGFATPLQPAPVPAPEVSPCEELFDRALAPGPREDIGALAEQLRLRCAATPWPGRLERLQALAAQLEKARRERDTALRRQRQLEEELAARDDYIKALKDLIIRNEVKR